MRWPRWPVLSIISPEEWRKIMDEFRGGVDYPVSLFYKELMEAYPEAKVQRYLMAKNSCPIKAIIVHI